MTLNKILKEAIDKASKIEKDYFERQIAGLILIMKSNENSFMVSRKYVIEKLNMILDGGIGFSKLIEEKLDG